MHVKYNKLINPIRDILERRYILTLPIPEALYSLIALVAGTAINNFNKERTSDMRPL